MKLHIIWFGFNSVYLDVWHSHCYPTHILERWLFFFPVFCQWNGNEDVFAVLYFVSLSKTSSFLICWVVGVFLLFLRRAAA